MDIIATGVLGNLTTAGPDAASTGPLGAADSLAAAQFSQIMQAAPAGAVDAAGPAPQVAAASQPLSTEGPRSLGETILSGMQNLSQEFQQSWKTVNAVLDSGSAMTTSDMLKLQMGLTQMSIQYDLVGKAISRSTQNLDQLVKMQ